MERTDSTGITWQEQRHLNSRGGHASQEPLQPCEQALGEQTAQHGAWIHVEIWGSVSLTHSVGTPASQAESSCLGKEGCRATYRRLTRQGLLKDSQTEPVLPTDLVLRGAGECPR